MHSGASLPPPPGGHPDHTEAVAVRTRFLCLSDSVFWLYQGSSRKGSLCHTYLRTVLTNALLMRMQRYTTRNTFMDLEQRM